MKTTQDYLDQLATATGIKSDYAIAKKLGISKQAVSNYRNKKASFDAYIAAKVAEELQIPEIEVIAAANAERAAKKKRNAEANYWKKLWNRVRSGAQALAVILALAVAWQPIDTNEALRAGRLKRRSPLGIPRRVAGGVVSVLRAPVKARPLRGRLRRALTGSTTTPLP